MLRLPLPPGGHLDSPSPSELSSLFPEPADPGQTPIALAQVIPGGHVAASQAIAAQIGMTESIKYMTLHESQRGNGAFDHSHQSWIPAVA